VCAFYSDVVKKIFQGIKIGVVRYSVEKEKLIMSRWWQSSVLLGLDEPKHLYRYLHVELFGKVSSGIPGRDQVLHLFYSGYVSGFCESFTDDICKILISLYNSKRVTEWLKI